MAFKLLYSANPSNAHVGTGYLFVNIIPPLYSQIPLNDGNNPPSYEDPPTPAAWAASHSYAAGATIYDAVGNTVQKCTTAGESGTPTAPSFNTAVGGTTTDNDATWTCIGPPFSWIASLPTQIDQVIRDNVGSGAGTGLIHICVQAGTSASDAPTWSTVIGGFTTDGTAIWQCMGPTFSVGGTSGAIDWIAAGKDLDIDFDQFTVPVDAVTTSESLKISGTAEELTVQNLAGTSPNMNPLYGLSDPNLPANAQNYEVNFFGGRQFVPKVALCVFSPRRYSVSPTKYFTAWAYKATAKPMTTLGFTKNKETSWKFEFDGKASVWRPAGYQVGGDARQT